MAVGLQMSKSQLDSIMGSQAIQIKQALDRALSLQQYFALHVDQEFLDMGYMQADIDLMRAAVADYVQAQRIMTGQVAVPTPASLISNAQHFWGTGF